MNPFELKLAQTRRKAVLLAFALNCVLSAIFLFGAYSLVTSLFEIDEEGPSKALALILAALALVHSAFWTRSNWSTGRMILGKSNRFLKEEYKAVQGEQWIRSYSGVLTCSLVLLLFALGLNITDVSFSTLLSYEGITGAQRIFTALLNPNWNILNMVLKAMLETIFIGLLATVFAIPVAFVLAFFCSRNLMNYSKRAKSVYATLRVMFNFTRSIEPVIWAIIFSVWVGIGPFAGMLALWVHSIASLAKLYSEQIECIDEGPIEAMEATGANRVQMVWYAVVPQVILPFLSYTIYRWDINIRMATIIGLVGGGGVGTLLMQYQGLAKWNEVGTIVIVIALVVWFMDWLSAKIREAVQ